MTAPRTTPGADRGVGAFLRWIRADLVPGRFLEGPDALRRAAPFLAAGLIPFGLLPFSDASLTDPLIAVAAAIFVVSVTAGCILPWSRLPLWLQGLTPLAYFAIAALLHEAAPDSLSPWYPLVALPTAWFALYGTRGELAASVAAQGIVIALPAWPVGGAGDDAAQLILAAATAGVSWMLGARVQESVGEMRRIAGESQAILDGVHEAFMAVDEDGVVSEWNNQAERTFGWTRAEMLGADVVDRAVPERDRRRAREARARFLDDESARTQGVRVEADALRRDGTVFPVEISVSSRLVRGRWVFYLLVHDISDRKRAESALSEAEERFRRAFEDIGVGMAIVSTDGVFLRVNAALGELTGYPDGQLLGRRFADITHPDDVQEDLDALAEMVEGERYSYRTENRYMHSSGEPLWVALHVSPIHNDRGDVIHVIAQMEDITERKKAEAELTRQALHDPLTGLPNRVLFGDRVRMAGARREARSFAVIYLDLDAFKPVNDTLGHAVGDRVLIEVARRLERMLREGDTLARLGGDEFAILCENVDRTEAMMVAERVVETLDAPFLIDDRDLRQSASIGVAIHPNGGRGPVDSERILRDADRAMYRAKAAGKSRYAVHEGWMGGGADGADAEGNLERDLRSAIDDGRLLVHYQPEIDLRTGAIAGAEALVRWDHPERGLLGAADFMFIAEATGLIGEIDDFVLGEACHQAARWRSELEPEEVFTVSVNLSEHRLADPDLSAKLAQGIADARLPPSSLCLEIAERSVMDRRAQALAAIPDIESLGVRLLVDDFGVAISSFSTIKRLPRLSAIKIDASFIAGLGRSAEDSSGVAAIVGLAHGLKLIATAEGVETMEQAVALRELDCDRAQGFYFARPQEPEAVTQLLQSARHGELLA